MLTKRSKINFFFNTTDILDDICDIFVLDHMSLVVESFRPFIHPSPHLSQGHLRTA